MRISSLYIAILFGVSLSWIQGALARNDHRNNSHKQRLSIRKRNGQTLDLSGLFGQKGSSSGPVEPAQIGNSAGQGYGSAVAAAGGGPFGSTAVSGAGAYYPSQGSPQAPPGSSGSPPAAGGGAAAAGKPASALDTLPLANGQLPTVPAVSPGPLPIPALPALALPETTAPTVPTLPTLPGFGPLPFTDEFNMNLDIFRPQED